MSREEPADAVRLERSGPAWAVAGRSYRLSGRDDERVARLADASGRTWADLRLTASADRIDAADETLETTGPADLEVAEADGAVRLTWTLRSTAWAAKRLVVEARQSTLTIRLEVDGSGELGEVALLGGRVIAPRGSGRMWSGAFFRSVVSAAPGDPGRVVLPATESTAIGVSSGSEPGRGRWFFTPAPFVIAASRDAAHDPVAIPSGPWLAFAVDAVRGTAGFTELRYDAGDRGFAFVLDYDGHTRVNGTWSSPPLVIHEAADPFAAIATQRDRLASDGSSAPARASSGTRPSMPDWWLEPLFCGWGAQCALATGAGEPLSTAAARSTQANYDAFLSSLAAHGALPGTVVIDDKWQRTYGGNEPDPARWPDLGGWIAGRHAAGQRVLLWFKAWDPEGLPAAACVRTAGDPSIVLAVDPTHPEGEAAIRAGVHRMLAADGLDADGLKIDFTARTPSGRSLLHHGPDWGVDLLARLLEILADEARACRPDALLIAHTPNPILARSVDVIRLNDLLRLDDPRPDVDPVPQMRFRAAVVRAALPDHPIDTDDWCAPDLARWRAYTAIKPELGIPAVYYVDRLDRTGEPLTTADFGLLRETWRRYREMVGLPQR